MPALAGASVTGSRAVLTLSQLGIGRTQTVKLIKDHRHRPAFDFPLEDEPDIRSGLFVNHHVGMFFIPPIAIGQVPLLECPLLHLGFQRRGNLSGNVLRVERIDHILQRNHQALVGAIRVKIVIVLLDGDKTETNLRKNSLKISPGFNVITAKTTEITDYQTLYPAAFDVGHQPVELRPVKYRTGMAVVYVGIHKAQIRTIRNVGLAYLNLVCNDIHIF